LVSSTVPTRAPKRGRKTRERSSEAPVALELRTPGRSFLGTILTSLFVFILPPVGTIAAIIMLFMGRVQGLHIALFFGGWLITGLGITVGYHRLLTHRSFQTSAPVKAILLIMGSMAMEGAAIGWVENHVKHHLFSDRDGDPHSPLKGFIHAHWGWLADFSSIEPNKYAPWAHEDPVARWVSRTFPLWITASYLIPTLIAGWEGLIWGGLARQFVVHNVTFAVNSVCHRWGGRPFVTNDLSTNNWVVGILGLGEGWHNNHHAFPFSAFHGLRWWQFDISSEFIKLLQAANLVWNVLTPNAHQIEMKLVGSKLTPAFATVAVPGEENEPEYEAARR
jgi:stearoyl-CoA desaturase (Delta-9 desaturase)